MSSTEVKVQRPELKDSLLHLKGTTTKLLLGMVGLPARGKTYIGKKLCRYLNWLGYNTKCFNVSEYRRTMYGAHQDSSFFDPSNRTAVDQRTKSAMVALQDTFKWFEQGGHAAIYDGCNTSHKRREFIKRECLKAGGVQVIWIESICKDESLVNDYIDEMKSLSPDYQYIAADKVVQEIKQRITYYESIYEPVQEDTEDTYVKVIDAGRQVVSNNMRGFLPGRIVSFLLNLRINNKDKVIYISRHGESEYNQLGKIGGDSALTSPGRTYAENLAEWIKSQPEVKARGIDVWCSTLKRTIETAGSLKDKAICWQALREIEVGICDGMTYEEVHATYPEEFAARKKDKLRYRYPRGESYMDVIARLEPVIFELERVAGPVLVIAHRAVLRCLFAYFLDEPAERIPYLDVSLHTVIKVLPKPYGCNTTHFPLGEIIEEREDGGARHKHPATPIILPSPSSTPETPSPSRFDSSSPIPATPTRSVSHDTHRTPVSSLSSSKMMRILVNTTVDATA